ncbi:ABC transporter permease subunit [Bradyrhizobium sp. 30]|uniref:ABC transporter permease subunit n=1 Tax=Bradyrhizobium sp. 30 TaxID=2782669 RepID=UPI0032119B56
MPIGLTVPAFAVLLVIFYLPVAQLFLTSLNAPNFSVVNYRAFFERWANVRVLYQTIEISALTTAICLVIGYPTAYLIATASKRLRIVLMLCVFLPWLSSGLVRTYAWFVILGDRGLINSLLLDLGLISAPLQIIFTRLAVYIGMVQIMLPAMIIPLLSVMLRMDESLVAAAKSMGARPSAAFWRVFFPLSLPGVRSGTLLVFIGCLGFYITPAALGGLRDPMLSNFIAAQIQISFNQAPIAATAFILLAVAAIVLSVLGVDVSGKQDLAVQAVPTSWRSALPSIGRLNRFLNTLATPYRAKRWTAELYKAARKSRWSTVVATIFVVLVMLYLVVPGVIVIAMSFSSGPYLEFPPSGVSLQWYRSFFENASWTGAAWISVQIGIAVAILSTVLGTLAAFGLNRTSSGPRVWLTMLILTPIMFPAIIVGIATYLGLLNFGLIGSTIGVILAHSIGAISYVAVIVSATLANFDRRLEQAAMSMRGGPLQTFMRITLPLIRPGIIGGALFAFIHSFDEVVITSLVGGFSVRTLPLKIWENMRNEIDPTIAAVASLLTLLPVLWLIALYVTGWRSRSAAQRALPIATGGAADS